MRSFAFLVKNDIVCDLVCKEMIENPKINFCSSLLGNLCHESLHNFDELQCKVLLVVLLFPIMG